MGMTRTRITLALSIAIGLLCGWIGHAKPLFTDAFPPEEFAAQVRKEDERFTSLAKRFPLD